MATSIENFVTKTLKLIEKERESEIEQTRLLTDKLPAKELQRRGVCLLKLHISSKRTGLFGRNVLVFETHHDSLPSHSISSGDIVGLNHSSSDSQSETLGSGVVTKVTQSAVSVAFDDAQDLFSLDDGASDYYKLTKLANDVTYKRLKRVLTELNRTSHKSCDQLRSVLFGEQELSPPLQLRDFQFINTSLDDSQQKAVEFALSQKEVAVVHGPPGTGKTTTVIEIILQSVKQGQKILACAPSNIAVDNLVERLTRSKLKVVRIGHPARVLSHIQKYSLDAILSSSDETKLVEDVRRDMDKTLVSMKKTNHKGEKQKLREDMKHLRKELRQREDAATREILQRAEVVLVTLTSATDSGPLRLLEESHFDVVVIDEVSQATEAACWIPLLRTQKCILAGDHLQLPPTIISKEAAKEGLEVTLMERVLELHGEKVMKMLTTQYRMHEKIMQWSSDQLYKSLLVAHHSVKTHLLRDLGGVEDNEVTSVPLVFVDTAGCDLTELDLPEEISKGNEGEADIVMVHVDRLVASGVKQADIAVIAPYNLQVELIRLRLAQKYPAVEVKSVDGFQGREKEAVIISLVRSNPKGEVGFLSERRRINVAVTRARRHLMVVGDSATVSTDTFLKSLVDYLVQEGEVQSAQQYIADGLLASDVERPEHLADLMAIPQGSGVKGARPKQPRQGAKSGNKKQQKEDKKPHHGGQMEKKETSRPVNSQETSRVAELQGQLDSFMVDKRGDLLEFPPSLTARERFLVHELAEKMGLSHTSKGEGDDRHIVVSKPSSGDPEAHKTSTPPTPDRTADREGPVLADHPMDSVVQEVSNGQQSRTEVQQIDIQDVHVNSEENKGNEFKSNGVVNTDKNGRKVDDGKIMCKFCGKDVIKANIQLHELHCGRQSSDNKRTEQKSAQNKKQNVSTSSKHRQFDKELAKRVDKVDKDDIDGLIATVTKMDSFCCFKKCKTSVQTLCNICSHCDGRYCMSHYMPEVHGCGDAARAQARAQISKEGVLYRGSGVPNKKPDADRKAMLQKRIDKKLTDMSSKRKGKPKKK